MRPALISQPISRRSSQRRDVFCQPVERQQPTQPVPLGRSWTNKQSWREVSSARDSQSGLSSGEECERLSSFLVGPVVAEHGPEHVDPSAGEGEDGLGVSFALGSFALVEGLEAGLRWMLIMAEV